MRLVPEDVDVPAGLEGERFRLRMLSVRDLVPDFEVRHALDPELEQAVRARVAERWPFTSAVHPGRDA